MKIYYDADANLGNLKGRMWPSSATAARDTLRLSPEG